jgi:hypothetical protein
MEDYMFRKSISVYAGKLVLLLALATVGLGLTTSSWAAGPDGTSAATATTIDSDIASDTTWTLAGSPYIVTKMDLWINPSVTLTIEPGVQVLLQDRAKMHIANGASLVAKGTPSQHITVTQVNIYSRWKTINHYAGSSSYYRYVDFTWGGKDVGSLYYEGPGTHTLNNCVIESTKRHAIYAIGNGLNLTVAGTRITDYELSALTTGNGATVQVTGSDISHTENKPGIRVIDATAVTVSGSSIIVPNSQLGISNETPWNLCVNAQDNWWGDISGPDGGGGGACTGVGSAPGTGTELSGGVDWRNYRTSPTTRTGIKTAPDISFSVDPDPNTAQPPSTVYTFDASATSDEEDYNASLDFCWDWEDDGGGCDATTEVADHSFSGGWHTVRLTVTDTDSLTNTLTQDVLVGYPPTATFTITQPSWSQVDFDPSGTDDVEDDPGDLEVRWDWEGDGVWDTGVYSVTDVVTHTYANIGRYWPTIRVEDTDGVVSTLSKVVNIIPPSATTIISGSGGTLLSVDGTVQIDMYTDTVSSDVISAGLTITHTPWITAPYAGLPGDFVYQGFSLTAETNGAAVDEVTGTYTITITYDPAYITGTLLLPAFWDQLGLYQWTGSSWELVPFTLDTETNQLVATVGSFGDFALAMDVSWVYLPCTVRNTD